jgi:hypothetical protein
VRISWQLCSEDAKYTEIVAVYVFRSPFDVHASAFPALFFIVGPLVTVKYGAHARSIVVGFYAFHHSFVSARIVSISLPH